MKKYIFTIITIAINLNLFAQNKINLHVNNGEIMQFSESDFNNNSDEKIQLKLEDPISSIKEYSFPASQLNNETVLENSQNKLSRVAFLSQTNPAILSDVETRQSGKIFYANIPYLTDSELKNLIANFEAVGKVFVSYDENFFESLFFDKVRKLANAARTCEHKWLAPWHKAFCYKHNFLENSAISFVKLIHKIVPFSILE